MISIGKVRALTGQASDATRETMTSVIFHSEVRGAAVRAGAGAEWVLGPEASTRIGRAWAAGESVSMVAQTIIWMWEGRQLAAHEDDRTAIRAAWRNRMEIK